MSDVVISVENLSKLYRLGAIGTSTLREDLSRGWARLRGRPDPTLKVGAAQQPRQEGGVFWALREISFEVNRGEVLGIIGANGAGKSTLLKILSRITAPTSGEAKLKGRIASLLEVGTGFHPDLSGRENIYLNGAILGMSKAEIRRKLGEIVAFSGLDEFIDTPVKRYSSGMYVRLAFAVAAHLDPEILILDEVLAVGDAQFQKKCLGKMGDVAKAGRTVLFVSHNMPAVQRLCTRALLLNDGAIELRGDVSQVTNAYLLRGTAPGLAWQRSTAPREDASFTQLYVADDNLCPRSNITSADHLIVVMHLDVRHAPGDLQLSMSLSNESGEWLFSSAPQDVGIGAPTNAGSYRIVVQCPAGILLPRSYGLRCALWSATEGPIELNDSLRFDVQSCYSFAEQHLSARVGMLAVKCDWQISAEASSN
jgi:lipopolysaccharide transport system ATP-binding protein